MKFTSFNIKIFIIMVCFLFHGCASYREVKEMKVNDSVTVENVEADELSACVWELMKEDSGQIFHRSYDPIKKKWFIIAEFRTLLGGGNGIYNFSVSFKDIENQKTNIEIRSLKTIWGDAQSPTDIIFQQIKQCQDGLK